MVTLADKQSYIWLTELLAEQALCKLQCPEILLLCSYRDLSADGNHFLEHKRKGETFR